MRDSAMLEVPGEKNCLLGNDLEKQKCCPEQSHSGSNVRYILGVLFGAVLGVLLSSSLSWQKEHRANSYGFSRVGSSGGSSSSGSPTLTSTNSKYTNFQALNFQLYTGGAPVYLNEDSDDDDEVDTSNANLEPNPECFGFEHNSASDNPMIGIDVGENTTQCYLGHRDVKKDVADRLAIMYDAIETAYEQSSKDPHTLKVFVAPEFFFRGRNGAYLVDNNKSKGKVMPIFQNDETTGECRGELCEILQGLETYTADARFEDWLFLFGTAVVAEVLPTEDQFDYLFYNFGLLYRGYDPKKESSVGKRFLVPKRYVSTSDFLHQDRSGEAHTREIYEEVSNPREQLRDPQLDHNEHNNNGDLYVPQRKKYDHQLWYTYKDEMEELGYNIIEYGWLMMDGLALTVEICLDHDLRTALTAFLVDSALPAPTLIPSSIDGRVDLVEIPRYQAQLSLVSSAGMTLSEESIALVNEGSIILQDGLNDDEPDVNWGYECFKYKRQFEGGSEVAQRNATMTPTEVVFNFEMQKNRRRYPIYDPNNGQPWQDSLRGVFSTARHEPMIVAHEPLPIARVF